jgi:hypothetical protein
MHATRGSRRGIRRYLCSSRRYGRGCDQLISQAEPPEEQLVDCVATFRPDEELRSAVLALIRSAARRCGVKTERWRELVGQLERLRDLYVMRDLSRAIHPSAPCTGRGVGADRPTTRRSPRQRRSPPQRFRPHLEARAGSGETSASRRNALRPRLARARHHPRRQTERTIPPLLQTADELAKRRATKRGVVSGSDGTRTRDLRRDRPVTALPGYAGMCGDSRREQALRPLGLRGSPGTRGYFRHPRTGSARDADVAFSANDAGSVPVPARPKALIATPPLKRRSRSATAASALTDAGKTARPRQEPCIAAQHRGT